MTQETVMAQGTAKLEECAEENCVITLGSKIGADFIVRGIISRLGANLTISVEMFETRDGNLVESSGPVLAQNTTDLLNKAAEACAEMYKRFDAARISATATPKTAAAPINHTVTATANPLNGGTVSRNPNQTSYTAGTTVSITAIPANGYEFVGWSGSSNSKNVTLTAPIDRDLTLTANFQPVYTLTAKVSPQGGGAVSRIPDKEFYDAGERVTITAEAAEEYKFIEWSGAAAGKRKRFSVTMDGDKAVTANFYKKSIPTSAAPTQNPEQSVAQKLKPKLQELLQLKYSAGGGIFYAGDFGGGLRWGNGEMLVMPCHLGGAYLFFDATYAAVSIGYSQGGAKWWGWGFNPNDLPYMQRKSFDIGVYAKYPNLIKTDLSAYGFESSMNIYPILGVDYEFPVFGQLEFNSNKPEYIFDGGNVGGYEAGALSAIWVKIGCGIDLDLTAKTIIRLEFLLGARTANWFEIDQADKYEAEKTRLGYGATLNVGAGFKL